jgi:hypothetical protein
VAKPLSHLYYACNDVAWLAWFTQNVAERDDRRTISRRRCPMPSARARLVRASLAIMHPSITDWTPRSIVYAMNRAKEWAAAVESGRPPNAKAIATELRSLDRHKGEAEDLYWATNELSWFAERHADLWYLAERARKAARGSNVDLCRLWRQHVPWPTVVQWAAAKGVRLA